MKIMKRFKVLGLISLFAFASLFAGCGFGGNTFGGSDNGGGATKETVSITLHDGTYSDNFSVSVGTQVKITELTKQGYYSLGYYDQAEGGTQYFEADGTSVSTWSKNYPTDFYAQYAPISSFKLQKSFATDEVSFSYWKAFMITPDPQFMNALKAHLNDTLQISISFTAYDGLNDHGWSVYVKNINQYSEGSLNSSQIVSKYYGKRFVIGPSYNMYSYVANVPASFIASGEKLVIYVSRGNTFKEGRIKNLNVSVTFGQS